ncbi:MAG TPA: acyl-homoserine-lactone synthase [Microvirga sp.]|nr:acyl-homoserine-lactone synthase [Microvirga sp.]
MVLLNSKQNLAHHRDLLEKVYEFRHRFFVDHLGWEALRRPDGREIDQFDTDACVHIVGVDDNEVVSYTRLLPTTAPHLMSHVYPEMLAGATAPTGPDVWEWTRCAVDPARREGHKGTDPTTARMFLAVAEACLYLGFRALLVQTHPLLMTRIIELGWKARPLALPLEYDGKPVVPIYAEVNEETLRMSREVYGIHEPVLTTGPLGAGLPAPSPLREPSYAQ